MTNTILLIIAFTFMQSCASDERTSSQKDDDNDITTETKTENMKSKKDKNFGEWEQDESGTKFREDYELKAQLSGYELVKYTRIDGGQFGGGSSTTKFTLCSDGSSKYYHQSLTTISVEGAGGSDAKEDDDYGTWRAIENEKGLKLIVIRSTKHNTTGYMEIKKVGSKLHMVWYDEWQEFLMKKIDC
jgi:hypothetical protein